MKLIPLPLTAPLTRVGFTRALRGALLGMMAAWLLAASPVRAQDAPYDRVQTLIGAGEWSLAMTEAQAWLRQQPRDPQMRFLTSVIHQQRGDADAARAVLVALTQDYPELPEPHNNLAVLEAAQGRLAEARAALETAIRLNPAYATAHRNLGDVYLRLSAQSYRNALLQASGSPEAVKHLQAVEQLLATPSR